MTSEALYAPDMVSPEPQIPTPVTPDAHPSSDSEEEPTQLGMTSDVVVGSSRPPLLTDTSVPSIKTELDADLHCSVHEKQMTSIEVKVLGPSFHNQRSDAPPEVYTSPLLGNDDTEVSEDEDSVAATGCESFCDADDESIADQAYLRRGMSITADNFEEFFGMYVDQIEASPYESDDKDDELAEEIAKAMSEEAIRAQADNEEAAGAMSAESVDVEQQVAV